MDSQQERYSQLFDSFKKNFDGDETSMEKFLSIFRELASQLSKLKIKDAFVDVGKRKGIIDFTLYLENGLFLSVAKTFNFEEDDEDVMFAIERNDRTLVLDMAPLSELMKKMDEIERQFSKSKE